MALHLSSAVNNMKSWSLGRRSPKSKKTTADGTPPRPKSMFVNMPSASSGAEVSSSIQASPSLTYSSSPKSRKSQIDNDTEVSPPSASKHLNTAQLKDKVRRFKTATPSSATSTSNRSSRPPLTAKNNVQNKSPASSIDDSRARKTSLPSLMKAPITASPTASAPLVSPAAAVVGGRPSSDFQESNLLSERPSSETPPSPSPSKREPLALIYASQLDHTCEVPVDHKEQTAAESVPTPFASTSESTSIKVKSKANEITPSKVEDAEPHQTAVASLRRFKGVEGFGSLEKKHARFDSMTVKESEDKENAQQQQKSTATTPIVREEQSKYPFEVRKRSRKAGANQQQQHKALTKKSSRRNLRRVEAKYDVAIVSQRVLSLSFGQARPGDVVVRQRRLLAVPIPSLFGCDQAASWAVERISRIAASFISVFGS
jgi:hypothetical protein